MVTKNKESQESVWRPLTALGLCLVLVAVAMTWMYQTERANLARPHLQGLEREVTAASDALMGALVDTDRDSAFIVELIRKELPGSDLAGIERITHAYLRAHNELASIELFGSAGEPLLRVSEESSKLGAEGPLPPRMREKFDSPGVRVLASVVRLPSGTRVLEVLHRVQDEFDGYLMIMVRLEPWATDLEGKNFAFLECRGGVWSHPELVNPAWTSEHAELLGADSSQAFRLRKHRRTDVSLQGQDVVATVDLVPPSDVQILSHAGDGVAEGWRIVGIREAVFEGSTLSFMTMVMVGGLVLIVVLFTVLWRSQVRLRQTEHHAAARLEAERSRLERIVNHLPVPVFFQNGMGVITMVNRAFQEFLWTEGKEIVGGKLADLVPQEESASLLEWDDPFIVVEEGARTQETTLINHYGELRKVSIVVSDCDGAGEDGEAQTMIGAVIDNTESVNAFQAMEDSLDLMTKVTSQVPGVVFEFKRRPDGVFCFPWASVGIQKIFELSPLDVEEDAAPVFDRMHPEDVEDLRQSLVVSGEKGSPWKAEFRVLRSSGEIRWMLGNAVAEREEDGAVLWHGFIADITDFKQIEEQLRDAKAEAEQANRAKSAFLAAMSHEIRTPMNGVIGMTSLLSQTALTEEQASYVHTIRHSGDALLVVINDILDFSKIESGRLELEAMPFDLAECIEGVVDILAPQAVKKGLAMAYFIDQQVPLKITGDVTRVRQILVNLVGNAIKFTTEGEVFINVDIVLKGSDQFVRVAVEDTGAGIPPSRADRLFKPFSQVDSSTNRIYGGTGLGLAISKRLTELMAGDLFFESAEGEGSSFFFLLPLDERAMGTRTVRFGHLVEALGDRRVLVVDDRKLHRVVISSYFEAWNMGHAQAPDFASALDLLREETSFDAVVIDRHLIPPEANDPARREFVQRVKTAGTRVIVMDVVGRNSKNDWDAFLPKPIKAQTLCQTMRSALLTDSQQTVDAPRITQPDPGRTLAEIAPLSILLAEDNRVNQKVATMILGKLGYKADIANNGREALDACRERHYDVVLMDVQMPEMDGLEATRAIRDLTEDLHQPWIIALTANATTGDRDQAIENGMNDYLAKPIKIEDLRRVLGILIERRQVVEERVDEPVV